MPKQNAGNLSIAQSKGQIIDTSIFVIDISILVMYNII